MSTMPPRILTRSPVGVVVIAWKVWQRLPPDARRSVVRAARSQGLKAATKHGPKLASLLAKRAAAKRRF
jgi:hypothetical protein